MHAGAHENGRFGYLTAALSGLMPKLKSVKDFLLGAFYLVSGIYSLGFGVLIGTQPRSISGNPAYVLAPDALLPYEIALFIFIGVAFLAAAYFQFLNVVRAVGNASVLSKRGLA
jgi:hypothetical protein